MKPNQTDIKGRIEHVEHMLDDYHKSHRDVKEQMWAMHFASANPDQMNHLSEMSDRRESLARVPSYSKISGNSMYSHVTSSLYTRAKSYLDLAKSGKNGALEVAEGALEMLRAYEIVVRTNPEISKREMIKGEFGSIGHAELFEIGEKDPIQGYVARLYGVAEGIPLSRESIQNSNGLEDTVQTFQA